MDLNFPVYRIGGDLKHGWVLHHMFMMHKSSWYRRLVYFGLVATGNHAGFPVEGDNE